MMSQTAIMGGLVLALILMCGVSYHYGKKADELQNTVDAQNERITALREQVEQQAAAMTERDKTISKLETEKANVRARLAKAIKADPKAKSWAETEVPASIGEALKEKAGAKE